MPPETKPSGSKPVDELLRYSGLAFQMAAVLAVFAFAGHWLDRRLALSTPWFTLLGCLSGLGLSLYQLIRQLIQRPPS
jgi:ATP synthase protein I